MARRDDRRRDDDVGTAPDAAALDAFSALYRRQYSSVRAYVSGAVRAADVDDVLAEVFLTVWRRRDEVVPRHERGWLIGVARHTIANLRRSHRRRLDFVEQFARLRPAEQVDPADALVHATQLRRVGDAMRSLGDADQEVLLLAGPYGLSHDDIAVALDTTANAVGVRIHRARRRLREATERLEGGDGTDADRSGGEVA